MCVRGGGGEGRGEGEGGRVRGAEVTLRGVVINSRATHLYAPLERCNKSGLVRALLLHCAQRLPATNNRLQVAPRHRFLVLELADDLILGAIAKVRAELVREA